MAVWDKFLTERDKSLLAAKDPRLGSIRHGFGRHPALLLIDNAVSAVGDEPMPIEQSIKKYPASMGMEAWAAVAQQARLLELAREIGMLVIHSNFEKFPNSPNNFGLAGRYAPLRRNARDIVDGKQNIDDFTPALMPREDEVVIYKTAASAFFGTSLLSVLNQFDIDTLLVGGNSTSGCVRATVVDGGCYNLHMQVVEECVYDRTEAAHAMSLFDMNEKYGDVRGIDEVIAWLTDPASNLSFPPKYEG